MEATLESFTIVATVTSPALADTHHRQPAIIDSHRFDDWFDPNSPLPRLVELVREPHASPYETCPISTRVNTDQNDGPHILAQVLASVRAVRWYRVPPLCLGACRVGILESQR